MQEPSPGTATQSIAVVPQNLTVFQNNTHQMIGSCSSDASDTVLTVPELSTSLLDPQAQAQLEADKRAVYKHPLFPLLALLFEKCEIATQCADASPSESFNLDIQAFVQHQERDGKPFFSEDTEVDGLMVKAIQVLRIHMLELEKVQELCKDFCKRYITCLKNKMQSENLLRTDYQGLGGSSESSSPNSVGSNDSGQQQAHNNGNVASFVRIQPRVNQNPVSMAAVSPGQLVSSGTVYQMVQTAQGIVAQPIQIQASQISQPTTVTAHVIHGSTPLSQIGVTVPGSAQEQRMQPIAPRGSLGIPSDDEEELINKKKQKRGVLPKHATSVMRSWLFQHLVHPYPTEDEKRQLAGQTNLTLLQVNNWFINARRRILQPMLDASNNENAHKSKKPKAQSSRCLQRFWPENIASLQPQVPTAGQSQDSNTSVDPGATGSGSSVSKHEDHFDNTSSQSCDAHLSANDSLSQSLSESSGDEAATAAATAAAVAAAAAESSSQKK